MRLKEKMMRLKTIVPILAIILFLVFGCDYGTNPRDDQSILFNKSQTQIIDAGNHFGFKLLREVSAEKPEENIFLSPLSVSMALGMTMNGAVGATYDSMRIVLGFGSMTEQEINEAYKTIMTILTKADPDVLFEIANAIWIREEFQVEDSFLEINRQFFDARAEALDFSNQTTVDYINEWVSEKTHEKIPTILDEISADVIMYLMNAIYFNGSWTREFAPENTDEKPFYLNDGGEMTIDMMSATDTLPYFETETFQAVDLPYGEGNFSMTILLPRPNEDINTLIANMDFDTWLQWIENFEKQKALINLPKFSLNFKMELNDVLKTMGMEIAFTPGLADFSHINEPAGQRLFISEVLHKTFLQVDEQGTEAAAVTSVAMTLSAAPTGIYMIVNRPFLCVIRERNSNTVLFAGKVMVPEPVK